jgi:ribosomal protein S27AE
LARRSKKPKIIIPGMWFFEKTRTQQEEYKNKNRPSGCENCTDAPIHSNDHLKTWMCGNCHLNEFSPKKNLHI